MSRLLTYYYFLVFLSIVANSNGIRLGRVKNLDRRLVPVKEKIEGLRIVGKPTTKPKDADDGEHEYIKKRIVNKHDFKYILNPGYEICKPFNNQPVFLLVYVHSAPYNFKRRLSLRETWTRRSMFRDMRLVFMMGNTEETDEKTRELLKLEYEIYKDIVQETFLDAYRNLTYKGIMAMKWVAEYCHNSRFILKVDDDILSNIFILLRHLNSLDKHDIANNNTIMCLVWVGMTVMRDKLSKWYVSKDEFKEDTFPKYCSGSAYILTSDLPPRMYQKSYYVKFFWVDDFYMTGLLAQAVNASYEFFNSLYIIATNLVEQRFTGVKSASHTVFGHLPGALNKVYTLWDFVLHGELRHFPHMRKQESTSLIRSGDFSYLKEFKWSTKIWDDVIKANRNDTTDDDYNDY